MESFALGLVLIGSLLHLGWNIFAKKAHNGFVFLWLSAFPLSIVGAFLSFKNKIWLTLEADTLTCIVLSGIVHTAYFWALIKAYKIADLSFVYPVCRSLGASIVVVLGILFLNESPSFWGQIGISLCIVAPLIEPLWSFKKKKTNLSKSSLWMTLLTGIMIGAYLFIDKIGSQKVSALHYLAYFIFPTHLFMGLVIFLSPMREDIRKENYLRAFYAFLFWSSAYGVVIWAMKIAPVSYVASARASGIVMSAIAGKLFFHESPNPLRVFSIILISIGVFLIAI